MRLIEWQRMWRRGRWFLGFICVIYSPMRWRQGGGEASLTHDPRPTTIWPDPRPTASLEHRRPPTPHDDTRPCRAEATHSDLFLGFFVFSLFLLWWEGVTVKGVPLYLFCKGWVLLCFWFFFFSLMFWFFFSLMFYVLIRVINRVLETRFLCAHVEKYVTSDMIRS